MDPVTVTIVGWIVQPAVSALFNTAQQYMLQHLGLSPSRSLTSDIKPLLDEYLQKLIARLDEERIRELHGALSNLKDAPKSNAMKGLLIEALVDFQRVANLPEPGATGGRPNAELRCMAFVGMAASYNLLDDRPELIAEKMVEAIRADADTARLWLGEELVFEIISRFPSLASGITCPKCGFRNPAGSRFCNRDGYPLNSGQKPPLQLSSQVSTLHLRRAFNHFGSARYFQIILDNKKIGLIGNGESSTFEIQPGTHVIFLRPDPMKLLGPLNYLERPSKSLAFDIAPNEEVTFLCQPSVIGLILRKQ